MKYVEILKLENDGSQKVAVTCQLGDDGAVQCVGDQDILESLNDGIFSYDKEDQRTLTMSDGLKFLEALPENYHSGYFNATEVKER
ncbi:MAG: hypothetical protein WC107_07020 [Patescibacteria group bacterium]